MGNRGFTLVETLVALAIFSASIVGMLVILGGGISNTTFVKGKTIATYLSQEGIELTRNLRDSYTLDGRGWSQFYGDYGDISTGICNTVCQIESDRQSQMATNVFPCAALQLCQPLNYDTVTGFYQHLATSNTQPVPFTRVLYITPRGSGSDELHVRSVVTWNYQGQPYSVESSTNLFNWQ